MTFFKSHRPNTMAKQLFPFRNRKLKNGNVYNIFPIAEFTKRQKQGPNSNLSDFIQDILSRYMQQNT